MHFAKSNLGHRPPTIHTFKAVMKNIKLALNAKMRCAFFSATTLATAMLLTACGGGSGGGDVGAPPSGAAPEAADISILFMGNSHTLSHDVPSMVVTLVRAGRPGKTVVGTTAPGSLFLEERLQHQDTIQLLKSRNWSAVILQAQMLSSSWAVIHPIGPAAELVKLSRAQSAVPVLFPEWARLGVNESHLIYDVYVSIAKVQPACAAPIPQAWALAQSRQPNIVLHAGDGNHSSPSGAFLAALVLYSTLTGELPRNLPDVSVQGVDSNTQQFLRGIATEAVQAVSPRLWCPAERNL
jgi:hypothetical protein